jgi:DNA-binding transcriptional MerR regulator
LRGRIFNQGDVGRINPDVSRKTLFAWAKWGLFEWVAQKSDARGIHREYSLWNLYQIGIVRELAGLNVPLEMIRIIMDRYFKDHIYEGSVIEKPPEEQHIKASESDRMTKCLIIYKDKGQRTWIWQDLVRNYYLCDISSVGNIIEQNVHISSFMVINLPAIVDEVHACIKKAGIA